MKLNENIVELKIFDFEVAHQDISHQLNLSPTRIWVKGEEYLFGDPRNEVKKIRENNLWEYRSTTISNDWIGDQVTNFIQEIILPRQETIKKFADKYLAEFSVVQFMYDGCNPGLYFDKKAMKVLSDCGLELNIDLYVLTNEK